MVLLKAVDETLPEAIPASRIAWILLNKIRTDHAVNTRPIDSTWVDRRVTSFDPDRLGVPILSEREDGTYVCLDGQNRIELCRRVGWGDQQIECRVFTGLTRSEEARLFLGHNDNRQVGSFHKFMARITAGDADAVAINEIVNNAGWELSYFVADKRIAAVAALEGIWKTTPPDGHGYRGATLTAVIAIATEAWGHTSDAANGQILRGLGLVMNRHGAIIDTAGLVRKLRQHRGGALGVLADARGLHGYAGGTVGACVAETVVRIYNAHRSTGRLPEWRAGRAVE